METMAASTGVSIKGDVCCRCAQAN